MKAAVLIDPENTKMLKNIAELRDEYIREMVSKLEREIESDFPDKWVEAERMILSNNLIKAEKTVDELFREEPDSSRTLYIKGLFSYRQGRLKESIEFFDTALNADSGNEKADVTKSKAQALLDYGQQAANEMKEGKYSEAVATLNKSLDIDRQNRIINQASYFQRALANFNAGMVEEAFIDYKKFELLKKAIGDDISVSALVQSISGQIPGETPLTKEEPTDSSPVEVIMAQGRQAKLKIKKERSVKNSK